MSHDPQFIGLNYSAEHLQAFLEFLKYWKLDEVLFALDSNERIDVAFIPKAEPGRDEFIQNKMAEPRFVSPDGSAYVNDDEIGVRAILDGSEEIAIVSMSGYLYRSGAVEDRPGGKVKRLSRKRRLRFLKIL